MGLTALVAAAVCVWLPYSSVYLDPSNSWIVAKVTGLVVVLYGVVALVAHRIRGDESRPARLIRTLVGTGQTLLHLCALAIPFGLAVGVFICLASANNRPLLDGDLAALDRTLGFDWLAFLELTNRSPTASAVLVAAYHSIGLQMIVVAVVHASMHRLDRLLEYYLVSAVCLTIVGVVVAMVPAAGAYAFFKPSTATFSNFTAHAGMWHHETLLKLRSGEPFALLLSEAQPLVTFPSFHTSLGVLIAYSMRYFRVVFWPVVLLEITMIVSTMPEGGHHLVDLIAGAAVAGVSVFVVRSVAYRTGMGIQGTNLPQRPISMGGS
ncbi:phosphatase PAP2 family protein [Mesorhizobium jarvisii]|uniref:phosphatase PAP2 family protein n=1 Tax=Mesorhizobium jarvisii TaxID=1777867 RepID=UPI00142DFCDB|nr:phosphatase PAP2 family protein [Mesorhizobium jarvisii]